MRLARTHKQVIYGALYLAVLALVVWGVAAGYHGANPSCSDGIQNQRETGIDCGGPCAACQRGPGPEQLLTVGDVQIFRSAAGPAVLLAQVENPNLDYAATSFDYHFTLLGPSGETLLTLPGTAAIYASEERYVLATASVAPTGPVSGATLSIDPLVSWQPAANLAPFDLSDPEGVTTTIAGDQIQVSGFLTNHSSIPATGVSVIAVLVDRSAFADNLFASETRVDLGPGGRAPFVISFPADPNLVRQLNPAATRVYVGRL